MRGKLRNIQRSTVHFRQSELFGNLRRFAKQQILDASKGRQLDANFCDKIEFN